METREMKTIRQAVRSHYAGIARAAGQAAGNFVGCCGGPTPCTPVDLPSDAVAQAVGYSKAECDGAPEGANLGLGCGNPNALAGLVPGETVLDLGAGAGFDCFLAAEKVGPTGSVIGVDMTPDMVEKARENAGKAGVSNVSFRLGEIEHLPVGDGRVDVVLSNCVINLSPDKARVFREAFRVLRLGGRLSIMDIVALKPLSEQVRENLSLFTGCAAGAALVDDLRRMLREAGFSNIRIEPKAESRGFIEEWFPGYGLEDAIASASIRAVKAAG